ncbi:hypothetical protein TSUD_323600 [Trifolium subterraneum]|uniref:Uncharacterized protein n=1 Tax=Trifolium subterraneum TaxID=3900 RepID=A0A2Z6NST0_TRISU|nr:hypothetical protein TSUD_323600 [Trifolium subterraneum]
MGGRCGGSSFTACCGDSGSPGGFGGNNTRPPKIGRVLLEVLSQYNRGKSNPTSNYRDYLGTKRDRKAN